MNRIFFFLTLMILIVSCNPPGNNSPFSQRDNLFNHGWEFVKDTDLEAVISDAELPWQAISLPHTANIEPLVIEDRQWMGTSFYRKTFFAPEELQGRHLALNFEGAMHESHVYLNGELIKSAYSGYLPFYVDISSHLNIGQENTLLVMLNNEDNPQIPPGKPIDDLDFNYFSGIYRNVWFIVKDRLHISDPVGAARTAAGGVLVTFEDVSQQKATVNVQVDVANENSSSSAAQVSITLYDNQGNEVAGQTSAPAMVNPGSYRLYNFSLPVEDPQLWSPSSPYLYDLKIEVINGDAVVDATRERIGIRTFRFTEQGFELNGQPLYIRGTNRHQEYPYVGYAISDNAQYRDAYKIRSAGFNFVRLSHYPHSKAFMRACDELGLLTMNAIPGWQFFGDEVFQQRSLQDVRKMMRRDRNHPSIILWEASLNETAMTEDYMKRAHEAVYEEYPGEDLYTCGWWEGMFDVYIPARQHGTPPHYWNHYDGGQPILIAEYGDWEYYAHNAGFNQAAFEDLTDEQRNSRQLRGFGQRRLAQQALNYQEAHNSNLKGSPAGDANWLVFDYNRGYASDLEASGIMDIFRLPKFAYWFYKSQARIGEFPVEEFNQPFVKIANYFNDPTFQEIKIYSNCQEVELFINGQSQGRRRPDNDQYSTHLNQPPFTFHMQHFVPGQLEARGFIDGRQVVSSIRRTPDQAHRLKLWVDESGRELEKGKNDMVFLYAAVVDAHGTILPEASNQVSFQVSGDAGFIGNNPMAAEAGIATVLLKAGDKGGRINITASANGLEQGQLTINVR